MVNQSYRTYNESAIVLSLIERSMLFADLLLLRPYMDQLKKKIQILKNHLDRFVMKSLHRRCVGLRIHEGFNEDIEFEILNQHNQHRKKENL